MPENGRILNECSIFFFFFFCAPGCPNPLESLERRLSEMRKINLDRKFSSLPAERERFSTPAAAPPGRIGARWPGGIGGSNRRVEPYGVRPSGPMAHRAAPWIADWRRRAGERAGETKNGTVPHGLPTVSSFASFRGVSAGRGRRTSGIDGADIGRGIARVKEYYRKKGNIVGDRPGGARCMGSAGRQGWKGTQDCVARRK